MNAAGIVLDVLDRKNLLTDASKARAAASVALDRIGRRAAPMDAHCVVRKVEGGRSESYEIDPAAASAVVEHLASKGLLTDVSKARGEVCSALSVTGEVLSPSARTRPVGAPAGMRGAWDY